MCNPNGDGGCLMAELTALSYCCGKSILHKLDVRFKLFFLVLISYTVIKADIAALFLLSFVLITVLVYIRFPIISSSKDLRYFFILVLLVFFARAFSTPGSALIEWRFIVVSNRVFMKVWWSVGVFFWLSF